MGSDSKMFAAALRYWRHARGWSQLDLSVWSDVSARHISCLETGRARPSREMVLRLAESLDVPLRDRDAMLAHADFAPEFGGDDPTSDPAISRAIDRMLAQQEPYPMLVMNRAYDIERMNGAARRLFSLARGEVTERLNAVDLLFDPGGIRPFVRDWERVARGMIGRVQRDCLRHPNHAGLAELLVRIQGAPGVSAAWRSPDLSGDERAAFAFCFELGGLELRFLTTLMVFNAPRTASDDELQIELYFPQDEETERACAALAQT